MSDKKTLIVLTTISGLLVLSACNKSPMDYYDEIFSVRKLSAKKPVHGVEDSSEQSKKEEGYKDPITGQQLGGTNKASEAATGSTAFAPLCASLVKSIKNEPWFYNFQANIKKAQEKNEHGEFIKGHMIFRRIVDQNVNYAPEIFADCGNVVLTIQSFPELRKLRALSAEARTEELSKRLTH